MGLPPASLNTIEKLSSAISNDPNYFQTITTSTNAKAPAATTYSKTQVDAALALKSDLSTTYSKTEVNAFLDTKPDDADLELKADKATTYSKTQVDTNIVAVVGAAPALLNTLVELSAALNNDANFATTITNALAAKAPLANPTFSGTVGGLSKASVGLTNVDNTSDMSKSVSALTTAQLNLKAPLASPTFTGTVLGISKAMVSLANVDDTSDLSKPVSTLTTAQLNLQAPIANPTFTGTVGGLAKATVGQTLVDNTSDLSKPVSTLTTAQSNLKAPLASPTFTETVAANVINVATDLSCGTLTCQSIYGGVIARLKTNLFASPSGAGTLTCADDATIGGASSVAGSRLNVAQNITNTKLNCFSSLYFNNTSGASVSEVGVIFCGQSAGLNLCTNTAHPIKLSTYISEGSVPASMQILATGIRDVEILAPLTVAQTSTFAGPVALSSTLTCSEIKPTGTPGVKTLKTDGSTAVEIYDSGTAQFYSNVNVDGTLASEKITVNGNLDVIGTVSFGNPHWIAVIINFTGGNP